MNARPAILLCVIALAGCATRTRVVKYNPLLGGLPGAESQTPIVRDLGEYQDPTAISPDKLVTEEEPGKKRLVARTGRHLMIHIYNTLDKGDKELFVREVLSKATKAECFERGVVPGDAFDYLVSRREDIDELFAMMPGGEHTPGVFVQPVGGGAQRIEVTGMGTEKLAWTGFDMVMEGGNWKLRWFTSGSR